MNKAIRFVTPLIAVAMMTSVSSFTLAQSSQAGSQTTAVQDWNTPPAGTEQAQQGYRDGIEAARLDRLANRKVDPKTSYLYTHPPVKKGAERDAYLQNFVMGYQAAVQHGSAS